MRTVKLTNVMSMTENVKPTRNDFPEHCKHNYILEMTSQSIVNLYTL